MLEQSLRDKAIKGTIWSAADAFLGQGITFVVGIVLARLLTPEEYGLIGICLIFNAVLNGIVDSGFSNALIRKNNVSDVDYNTMFITNIVISMVLYLLLYIFSPWVAYFFERPELGTLVRAAGLVLIINALSMVQSTILTKSIDFKTKTKASFISAIFSGIVGIGMAFSGFGVWALIGQMLSKQIIYTILLWFFNKWSPKFSFCWKSFQYMWGYGWKLMVSGILNNLWNQLYQIVVGKWYSPATLGQYTRADGYASLFSSNLTVIIQRVSLPILSKIQDDKQRMVEAYRKLIKMTMFVTTICMISLAAVSEPLIYTLIGPKWIEASTYLPLICISMSLYPLHAINLNMLQILGRSDVFLYLEIIKKVIGLMPVCVGIFINIYWMLISSIVTSVFALYLNSWYTGRFLGYSFGKQLKDVIPFYLIAFFIGISIYFIKYLPLNCVLILILQVLVAFIMCVIVCNKLSLSEFLLIKSLLKDLRFPKYKI